jgi:hypothetical protein
MIKVEKKNTNKDFANCNFCERKLDVSINRLVVDYDHVYEFSKSHTNSLLVSMCDKCFNELSEKINKIRNNIV